jgi:hypothetical protein
MLLSIGDQVKPGSYRLHSVFQRAVNFERRGRLISVVDESIGPGPLNIVFRDLRCAPLRLGAEPASPILKGLDHSAQGWIDEAGGGDPTLGKLRSVSNPERVEARVSGDTAPLQITTRTVLFAGHRYPFTGRHRYHSTLELKPTHLGRFQSNLSVLREVLAQGAPPKSLAFLLDGKRRKHFRAGFERAYAGQIERGVRQVFQGDLLKGIRLLKGCGVGLTPAGDDFIAGLLTGLHVLQKLRGQDYRRALDSIFRAARGSNIFSNTFLELARRSLLFGRLKDLLMALASGSAASVREAGEALFRIGETSGADLATGLLLTLRDEAGAARVRESQR